MKTIGRGHIENVRYEILFGINDAGKNFKGRKYIGPHDDIESHMEHLTNQLVTQFDERIGEIERKVNMVYAMQWIIISGENVPERSCVGEGPFATDCWGATLGDPSAPICEVCYTKEEIEKWYRAVTEVTGTHVDPRIKGRTIDWPFFGNKMVSIFQLLRNKEVASVVDWRKVAHLTRAILMYILSIKMTQTILHDVDAEHFSHLGAVEELMARNRTAASKNVKSHDQIDKAITDLLKHLTEEDQADDIELFQNMTSTQGILFRRNEREDYQYYGRDYEHDEYICINYLKKTNDIGEVHGRMLAGRKEIIFNPLKSPFVESLSCDSSDSVFSRLKMLGLAVGQTVTFPTRRLRNEHRRLLWDELEKWPACTESEGTRVNFTEVRYKCTVPAVMQVINTADAVTQLNEMRSPIELL